ncbi:MAG: transcription antitermination factor NusB [Planctomycetota bacterium]
MPTARDLALDALLAMERDGTRAKETVDALRDQLADPRDRGLLTEIVYGVVRRLPTLDALLAAVSKTPLRKLDPAVHAALRCALYQALFLDRIPAFAAVDAAVEAVKTRTNPRLAGFANGVLRTILRSVNGKAEGAEQPRCDLPRPGTFALRLSRPVFPDPARSLAENLAVRYAHPAWLVDRWLTRVGPDATRRLLALGCGKPPLSLRARPGLRDDVLAALAASGVAARAGAGPDEVLAPDGDAIALDVVRDGRAAVQDGTAQRVAPLAAPRPGERVLDLCAAPGGKTLHVLDLLLRDARPGAPQGEVVAADVDPAKVEHLAATLATRPPGGPAARAVLVPAHGPLPFPAASFDLVLVDAPCSNTGVFRRRPEVRLRLRPEDVASLVAVQDALLERALPLVRPGGRLLYATCSIEPEENEGRIARLLAAHPRLVRRGGFDAEPTPDADGGFAALLEVPADGAP